MYENPHNFFQGSCMCSVTSENISHLIKHSVLSLQPLLQPRSHMQEFRKKELDGQQILYSKE